MVYYNVFLFLSNLCMVKIFLLFWFERLIMSNCFLFGLVYVILIVCVRVCEDFSVGMMFLLCVNVWNVLSVLLLVMFLYFV